MSVAAIFGPPHGDTTHEAGAKRLMTASREEGSLSMATAKKRPTWRITVLKAMRPKSSKAR
jgi:hypothetical protein